LSCDLLQLLICRSSVGLTRYDEPDFSRHSAQYPPTSVRDTVTFIFSVSRHSFTPSFEGPLVYPACVVYPEFSKGSREGSEVDGPLVSTVDGRPCGRMCRPPAWRANVAGCDATVSDLCMDIQDAQREVRSVYIGGFWGQLVSSVIWLVSAALGTWVTPRASILTVVIGGFFIFPLTQMLLRLSGRRASVSRDNSFNTLGMQVAFVLPFSMLLLVPVGLYDLNLFFPALMVLLGAHYFPFATLYGMRMFLFLGGILIAAGVVIAHWFSGTFSLGAWVGGLALLVFACIGRSIATGEASAPSTH